MCNKRILWIGCMDDDKEFELKCSKGHNLASFSKKYFTRYRRSYRIDI